MAWVTVTRCSSRSIPRSRTWFARRFPAGPTTPQAEGWREIAAGNHTLIAAPTGSGKTLAAFLVCIDRIYRAHEAGAELGPGPRVVYVSPLKALAVDIHLNLERPLAEIADTAKELGLSAPSIRVAVRTGDTAAAERAAMLKQPPDFLITTPESLYLHGHRRARARDAGRGPDRHRGRDPRGGREQARLPSGAHAGTPGAPHRARGTGRRGGGGSRQPLQRIGLSATQRPLELVARLLVGAGEDRSRADGSPRCAIVDSGHRRDLDLALELPNDELGAVASSEQMAEILDLIAGHVEQHRTTLVFVNTRRMAERVAHQLGERLGDGHVAAHHGSLSKDRRQRVESRLRSGDLKALVATASLELGIDIGPVELVCQIGSPRSFATFLQRVGRSNHTRTGTPSGRLYPTSRDELVECAALLRGVRQGRLDVLIVPDGPLDILAQQTVAECAAEDWPEQDLLAMMRRAAPFQELSQEDFERVAELVSEGIRTGRGRRAAYLHRDQVTGQLRGRRGARIAALTSGGAIPELGDYRVLAEPDGTLVGTVNEDWAIESMAGDVFLLGTHSWRIRRVEPGVVRVIDAEGAPPSIPFWLGEAPGRTRELSEEVSAIREAVAGQLTAAGQTGAVAWLRAECGIGDAAAETIAAYLAAGLAQLGVLPTMDTIVLERFFDEAGGMQLVGHTPFGARLNRALGLALRKRFCVNVRLRAAGGGQRQRDPAVARAAAQLPAGAGAEVPGLGHRGERGPAGGADLADVRRALAVEPEHLARGAADARRQEEPARDPADGGRRPDGGGVPDAGRLPGERGAGPDGDPGPRAGASDPGGLPARGHGHRRPARADRRHRVRPGVGGGQGHDRAVGARARDPQRAAVHVPRRRPAGGAPVPPGAAAPRPAGRRQRAGQPGPGRDRAGRGAGAPRSAGPGRTP